jgi:hypothetical protein
MTHDFQLKEYEDLSSRWYSKALLYAEKVKAKFLSVLKFPYGGWMVDAKNLESNHLQDEDEDDENDDDDAMSEMDSNEDNNHHNRHLIDDDNESDSEMDDDEQRQGNGKPRKLGKRGKQLKELRKLYLPNMCFVLLDLMSKMNLNKELIKLADLIACDNYKLYSLFEKCQLKCLLNKMADSSINLVDTNNDYLGYN